MALALPAATSAGAGTLMGRSIERRTVVGPRVAGSAIADLLPAGWGTAPAQGGPVAGANLLAIFTERLLAQDASVARSAPARA